MPMMSRLSCAGLRLGRSPWSPPMRRLPRFSFCFVCTLLTAALACALVTRGF